MTKDFLGVILVLSLSLGLESCGPVPDLRAFDVLDVQPPVLVAIRSPSGDRLMLEFDEDVHMERESVRITPEIPIREVSCEDGTVTILFDRTLTSGAVHAVEAEASDARGNRIRFLHEFYGFNPDLPRVLLNELIVQGSGGHPDAVEIFCLSEGNTAGLTVFQGTPVSWGSRYILPPITVRSGDYIIIHWKPQGIPEEIDETDDPSVSGGYDSSPTAWDLWVSGGTGLPGNNGVVSLFSDPYGILLDGVLYSNRTSASDERYLGFGTRTVMEQAIELWELGGWISVGEMIAPEDAVDPTGSTGTRSIGRNSESVDTDSREDWHIVPTRGATLGLPNADEVYDPNG